LEAKTHPLFRSDKQAIRQINSKATHAPAACSTLGNGSGCANAMVASCRTGSTSVKWLRPASA